MLSASHLFTSKLFFKIIIIIILLFFSYGIVSDIIPLFAYSKGTISISGSIIAVLALCFVEIIVAIVAFWKPSILKIISLKRNRFGWFRWILIISIAVFLSWLLLYSDYGDFFNGFFVRLLFYSSASFVMAWLATQGDQVINWNKLLLTQLLFGGIFSISVNFQSVIDYPFTLYWSEGNRFWDYSTLYGRYLYLYPPDIPIPAYIDPVRQSLWGLPFIFGPISIQMMRAWNAILFTVPYMILGWFILWPQKKRGTISFLFGMFTYLFLNDGPVYTPLIIAAILVAVARRMPIILSLLTICVAGGYAALGRFTWIIAPAFWIIMITLIDPSLKNIKSQRYIWVRSGLLGVSGIIGGFFIPKLYPSGQEFISAGSMASEELSSISGVSSQLTRQPLLWERLLPNSTYPEGILISLILLIGPLLIITLLFIINRKWNPGKIKSFLVGGILLAFLIVGLVTSVKIGGGSNLHNLDMFLVAILFFIGLLLESGFREWIISFVGKSFWSNFLLLFIVVFPFFHDVLQETPLRVLDRSIAENELLKMKKFVRKYQKKREVLFIDQRQLLTFGFIKGVPLVPEYEKKRMMDEALSNNQGYFENFYNDLINRRFVLIVSEVLSSKYQDEYNPFSQENNAWVKWVARPLLCYYYPLVVLPGTSIFLLSPRNEILEITPGSCPRKP